MARVSSVEPCMFCSQLPCKCNDSKPKPKAKPRSKPRAAPISEPVLTAPEAVEVKEEPPPIRQSMVDRMRARAAQAPPLPPPVVRARPKIKPEPELTADQIEMIPAVRLLVEAFNAEIIEEDAQPWRKYLDKPPSVKERAQVWRRKIDGRPKP